MLKPSDIFTSSSVSPWRVLSYTLIFCLTLPILFALLGDEDPFIYNLVFSFSIGFLAHLFGSISVYLLKNYNAWFQWLAVLNSIILATLLGVRFAFWATGADQDLPDDILYVSIAASLPMGLFFGGIIMWVFYSRAKVAKADAERLELQLHSEMSEKQLSQAQLNLLQAQIEPHFLFNTLATVHSLIEAEPKRASSLLEEVNTYLRTALDHSRSKDCLLAHEIHMLRSYLGIMKTRMGTRFEFDIIIDNTVLKLPFPPMLLQPLVENAIKHGLEPKINGGTLQISGMLKNGKLCLDVIDSGVGFADFKGEGIGLSNVRDRLNTLYSGAAIFEISELGKRGVRASIQIPVNLL